MDWKGLFSFIPEVTSPEEKKLSFKVKLKWTLIVLAAFFILANIPLFGMTVNALERFEYLAIILGTDFGSIISLGIGPIVMASIILQLLTGAGILNIDTTTSEGKKFFQGLQKVLVFFFIIFEAMVYVFMNGLEAAPGFAGIVIFQLILGGLAIFYMNELCEKWGFGSGVSLFIAAGVSWRLFASAFQFIDQQGVNCLVDFAGVPCSGKVLVVLQSIITRDSITLLSAIAALVVTALIFLAVVWVQSLKVEIPLSYGRIRGYGVKWPLSFFYANVIPVILAAALIANFQLIGGLLENWLGYPTFLGGFVNGQAVSGLSFWLGYTNILDLAIRGGLLSQYILQGIIHVLVFALLCMVFSIFWVKSSGMDAKAQAKKIASSGLQVAGFRQDIRILESILERYIMPLTVMGGLAIGILASVTDLFGAIVSGTAILLVIMIMFQFYQNIAQQHMTDMNPALRKFMGGGA
ncbi:preprotein translocase subunit SecY [Candidatus Pacearchaeota archaeon CG10_big_fil_rev_8_21_14_0_10_32_42]|nr:MAG: preprotein translocase subunit SecY [Candidatus Pacearchaeota archaeon CG10_big_fil_rev_8_21_14_0_10_32_42]